MQDVNQLNYLSVWRYIIAYLHAHCKLNGINQKYIFIYIAAKFVIRKIFTSIKLFTPNVECDQWESPFIRKTLSVAVVLHNTSFFSTSYD